MPSIRETEERLAFAKKAIAHFAEHPEHSTYGEADNDTWFAVRWGLHGKAVRVFRISTEFPVETFWE